MISASWSLRQLSLVRIRLLFASRKSSAGSASTVGGTREGPRPRTITRRESGPVMMKAFIMMASAVPTIAREVSRLNFAILGLGLGVATGVDVAVGLGVGVE